MGEHGPGDSLGGTTPPIPPSRCTRHTVGTYAKLGQHPEQRLRLVVKKRRRTRGRRGETTSIDYRIQLDLSYWDSVGRLPTEFTPEPAVTPENPSR